MREFDGPCLALYPVGQFWKPGDAGLHYKVFRRLLEFHGESNPDAKFYVSETGMVSLINGLEAVSVAEFNGEVMRTVGKEKIYEDDGSGDKWNPYRESRGMDKVLGERVVELTDEEKGYEEKIIKKLADLKAATTTTD